jgi:hypothetical protein
MTHPENTRVVLLTALCLAVLAPVAPASAQNTTSTSDAFGKSISLGSGVTFEGCELDGSTMRARFDASRPASVTLYDAGVFSTEGSFSVPSKDVNLGTGTSTVEMPVTVKEGSAALFIRSESSATGCTKDGDRVSLFDYVAGWLDVQLTYVTLFLSGVSTFAAVAYRFKTSYSEKKRLI